MTYGCPPSAKPTWQTSASSRMAWISSSSWEPRAGLRPRVVRGVAAIMPHTMPPDWYLQKVQNLDFRQTSRLPGRRPLGVPLVGAQRGVPVLVGDRRALPDLVLAGGVGLVRAGRVHVDAVQHGRG